MMIHLGGGYNCSVCTPSLVVCGKLHNCDLPNELSRGLNWVVTRNVHMLVESVYCRMKHTYHQKECEKAIENVIEIRLRVLPDVLFRETKTFCFVWNNAGWYPFAFMIHTCLELARKQLDTKNAEY